MTRTSRLSTLLSLTGALALGSLVHAQTATAPGAAGGGASSGGETVTNTNTALTATTTTTDPVGADGIDPNAKDTLKNTGGEPLLMLLGGMALAGGAFALRRKLA